MSKNRQGRINDEVREILSEALRRVKDPRVAGGLISIVRCEVTGDMRYCKVFFSVLGSEEVRKNAKKGMEAAAGWLRRELSAGLGLRYTPELVMVLDDSISHGAHISQILRGLEETKD